MNLPFQVTREDPHPLSAWESDLYYGPGTHEHCDWQVAAGRLEQQGNFYSDSPSPDYEGAILRTWETGWRDVVFTVQLGTTDNDALGVLFRYQDDDTTTTASRWTTSAATVAW